MSNASVYEQTTVERVLSRSDVEDFLYAEARLLDERRFEEWEQLYTDDGQYWVPARPGQTDPYNEISIYFDDRELMRNRIARLRHPEIHVQTPPSRTVRLISNVMVTNANAYDVFIVDSALLVVEYRKGLQRVFAGHVTHELVQLAGQLRIRQKKVELVNADASFQPLAIPF